LKEFFLSSSDLPIMLLEGPRRKIFPLLPSPFEEMAILLVEGGYSIERKVGDIWKITHPAHELFEFFASFQKERLHLRTLKDERTTSIELLGEQGLDHFVSHLYQSNITLYNSMIDFIQPLEAGEGNDGNEEG